MWLKLNKEKRNIVNTENDMLTDISSEIDREFGLPGTTERTKFDEDAHAFYTEQILIEASKDVQIA